jgi:hypothetical protein
LWNHVAATILVEGAMFAVGLLIYARGTRARDGIGRWGLIALAALLMLAYVANVAGGAPPSVNAIAIGGIAGAAVLTLLAWWVDRHRDVRP